MTICPQCPWRLENHGKRHPGGFYRKDNLRRLWNQIRGGGAKQGCHLTDPRHPDHVAAGAPLNAKPQECAGSVILIYREFDKLKTASGGDEITPEGVEAYLADPANRRGLKRDGLMYWLIARVQMGNTPLGDGPIPDVTQREVDDPAIGLGAAGEVR